jgi:hypothetical protein
VNDGRLAYDPNRLPWLPNEQRPPPRTPEPRPSPRRGRAIPWAMIVPWTLLALLLVAGFSYWLGMRSIQQRPSAAVDPRHSRPEASITLPRPREAEPMPPPPVEVAPVVEPVEAEPEPAPVAREPRRRKPPAEKPAPAPEPEEAAPTVEKADPEPPAAAKPRAQLQAWPADTSSGASGRMVRIGTFSSSRQAKRGWWRLMRAYPGMRRLKAVVVPIQSQRNSRTYYRLQFGTTSHAHSAVLCQRMRIIGQSCVVVGL